MRHAKAVPTFWVVLLLFQTLTGIAQTDSLADLFPLAVGSTWTYDYTESRTNLQIHWFVKDTGTAKYVVTSEVVAPDSTIWEVFMRRNFQRTEYGNPYVRSLQDSGSWQVIEKHEGKHELYCPQGDPWKLFTFAKAQEDSQKFFRYGLVDSMGNATFHVVFQNGALFPPTFDYWLRRRVGITKMSAQRASSWLAEGTRYSLKEFQLSYPSPHLSIPPGTIILRTTYGRAKDSTIVVHNWGLRPVQISTVTPTSNRLTVPHWSHTIPPLSDGTIGIRFETSVPETINASIIVFSDSETSPDTLNINGESVSAAVSSLSASYILFGSALSGIALFQSISFTNVGNMPLVIYNFQQKWYHPAFGVGLIPTLIEPQQRATLTFSFTAPSNGYGEAHDTIFFYSNSPTSPDQLYLSAQYSSGAYFSAHGKAVEFAPAPPFRFRDTVVTITSSGDLYYLERSVATHDCFFSLNNGGQQFFRFGMYRDTIRFAPTSSGIFSDTIFYRYSTFEGPITGADTLLLYGHTPDSPFYLSQNFPNPFNPTTTIRFQTANSSFVTLKVFDLLGREVATLANEEMKPGSYERVFNGASLASGVYLYRLNAGVSSQTRKLLLIH